VDFRRSVKVSSGRGFDSEYAEPLQVSWNRKIKDSLDVFIPN
jgi:hypothetical protein